jgi:hypothetical protein
MTVVGPPTGSFGAITAPTDVVADWRDKV